MKYRFGLLLLLPICILLSGCPVKSNYPVDVASCADDKLFAGSWKEFINPSVNYKVGPFKDGSHIVIEQKKHEDGSIKETMYYGTISRVAGSLFLSLFDTSRNKQGYYIYRIEYLTSSKLVLLPLSGSWLPEMNKPGQLKAWLLKNKDRSNFYSTDELAVYMKN